MQHGAKQEISQGVPDGVCALPFPKTEEGATGTEVEGLAEVSEVDVDHALAKNERANCGNATTHVHARLGEAFEGSGVGPADLNERVVGKRNYGIGELSKLGKGVVRHLVALFFPAEGQGSEGEHEGA